MFKILKSIFGKKTNKNDSTDTTSSDTTSGSKKEADNKKMKFFKTLFGADVYKNENGELMVYAGKELGFISIQKYLKLKNIKLNEGELENLVGLDSKEQTIGERARNLGKDRAKEKEQKKEAKLNPELTKGFSFGIGGKKLEAKGKKLERINGLGGESAAKQKLQSQQLHKKMEMEKPINEPKIEKTNYNNVEAERSKLELENQRQAELLRQQQLQQQRQQVQQQQPVTFQIQPETKQEEQKRQEEKENTNTYDNYLKNKYDNNEKAQEVRGGIFSKLLEDKDGNGIPDFLERKHKDENLVRINVLGDSATSLSKKQTQKTQQQTNQQQTSSFRSRGTGGRQQN